jgi:hypothetical protein
MLISLTKTLIVTKIQNAFLPLERLLEKTGLGIRTSSIATFMFLAIMLVYHKNQDSVYSMHKRAHNFSCNLSVYSHFETPRN